jgi:hypothetical protein
MPPHLRFYPQTQSARPERLQAIFTLRSLIQSDRFDSGWRLLAGAYKTAVEAPDNVVALNARRR